MIRSTKIETNTMAKIAASDTVLPPSHRVSATRPTQPSAGVLTA